MVRLHPIRVSRNGRALLAAMATGPNRELLKLAQLLDSGIDTKDIPERSDWTSAVRVVFLHDARKIPLRHWGEREGSIAQR
jgi:hypothetical protein